MKNLARARAVATKAQRAADKAREQLVKLHDKRDRVKPRKLSEAKEKYEDLKALANHASDRVEVARNHVRLVILEEYPPRKQARLLEKHLPEDKPDTRPFSF